MELGNSHICDKPGCWYKAAFHKGRPLFFDYSPDGIEEYLFCSDECLQDWLANCYEELFGYLPGDREEEYA